MKEEGGGQSQRKNNILAKTLQRCRTSLQAVGTTRRPSPPPAPDKHRQPQQCWGVPAGCFAVLVGPDKDRFVVRARCANHPLFRALLDEAESEYGFAGRDGPLELPCSVDDFMEVMWEMERGDPTASPCCGGGVAAAAGSLRMHQGYQMMSPARTFLVAGRP